MTRATILELQRALLGLGYRLPRYGADGYWGRETWAAVNAYLTAKGQPALAKKERPGSDLVAAIIDEEAGVERVRILGCDVSGYQNPKAMDWTAFQAAGGRFVYVKRSEAKVRAAKAEDHLARIRAANDELGLDPADDGYIHPAVYHFINYKYSVRARRDAKGQADFFADHVLRGELDTTGWRAGDCFPAWDFESNAWLRRPAAKWVRAFADRLRERMFADAGCTGKGVAYGYGWTLLRLRSQDWSDHWVWCGASPHVVVPRMWPRIHIQQTVQRQPWAGGRRVDTNELRVPIAEFLPRRGG